MTAVPEMVSYLDSSAVVKLVFREAETEALRRFLRRSPSPVSSTLARVEVSRAVRRVFGTASDHARASRVLSALTLLAMSGDILSKAATIGPPLLRTLDAIHLATALSLGSSLGGLVTYDERLAEAARLAGVTVYAPR